MTPTRSIITIFGVSCFSVASVLAVFAADPATTPSEQPASPPAADAAKTDAAKTDSAKTEPTPTKPPEESPVPFIIRIDRKAVERFAEADYNVDRPVDEMVLGARAVGTSHTTGKSHAVLIPNLHEARFDIVFRGRTTTATVGTKEPAKVFSRTATSLECTRQIVFDPRRGFIPHGETKVTGDTTLVYDGFASTRQFGRRLITRIAQRKAYQQHEAARQIADRNNKRDVREEFEAEVDKSLAEANKNLTLEKYVKQFFGEDSNLELFTKSSADCIHIGVGPAGEKYAPMTQLPPRRDSSTEVEIWAHSSIFSGPVAKLVKLITPEAKMTLVEQSNLLGALAGIPTAAGDPAVSVAIQDGWLVLGLPNEKPPMTAAAAPKHDTHRK